MNPLESAHCQHEDAIVSSFVDGELSSDIAFLARHLQSCVCCARALEASRKVDSLLAAQTETSMTEARAEELLGFLDGAGAPPRPRRWPISVAAAALLAAGVFFVLARGRRSEPADARPDSISTSDRESGHRGAGAAVRRAAPVVTGHSIRVPRRFVFRPRPAAAPDASDLLAAFEGRWVPGLSRPRLRKLCEQLLRQGAPSAVRAPLPLVRSGLPHHGQAGPRRLAGPGVLQIAAARWLLSELRRGEVSSSRFFLVVQAVLGGTGPRRRALVELLRANEDLVRRHLVRPLERRRRFAERGAAVAVCGALGILVQPRRLAKLDLGELLRSAGEARRTGDRRSLDYLVHLYVAVASRSEALARLAAAWFAGLDPAERAALSEVLEARIADSPCYEDRQLLRALTMHGRAEMLENP